MKGKILAKILLLVFITLWGCSEWNVINANFTFGSKLDVFDKDFGDRKVFLDDYSIAVNWENQKHCYTESAEEELVLQKVKSFVVDMSWVPFFKHYHIKSTWQVAGFPDERKPIEVSYTVKKFGLVSRNDVMNEVQQKISEGLVAELKSQSFYAPDLKNFQIRPIFN